MEPVPLCEIASEGLQAERWRAKRYSSVDPVESVANKLASNGRVVTW